MGVSTDANIDVSGLKLLEKNLKRLAQGEIREYFRAAHKRLGEHAQDCVRSALDQKRRNPPRKNPTGVKEWQVARFGSGGGYTAVSPEIGEHKGYAKGYVTNAVESGHVSHSSQTGHVYGLHFYKEVRSQAKNMAEQEARELLRELEAALQEAGDG